jgi:asparagine synthase (glutamine-hydrolysing)
VKMHHVEMTEETFAANIEDAVWHNEVAVKDLGTVGKYMLSKLTRDAGIKVVLTGEGSDEHFGGYRELLKDFVREQDSSKSSKVRNLLIPTNPKQQSRCADK